jgi:hypothetical protein
LAGMALLPSSSNLNPRIYDLGLGLYKSSCASVDGGSQKKRLVN